MEKGKQTIDKTFMYLSKGLFINDVINFGGFDLWQNSVRRVADDYLFSSAALSMFRFDMTHDLRLEMFLKLWAYLKFQQKEGILSSGPYPPPPVSSCHLKW